MTSAPADREAVVRDLARHFGGRLHQFHFCLGQFDGVAIVEFESNEKALAFVMAVFGRGRVDRMQTTPLLSSLEGKAAMTTAQQQLLG